MIDQIKKEGVHQCPSMKRKFKSIKYLNFSNFNKLYENNNP